MTSAGKRPEQPEPLDEMILGEDEEYASPGPRSPRASPLAVGSTTDRPGPDEDAERARVGSDGKVRRRPKLTLRIPDDEVSRPSLGSGTARASSSSSVRVAAPVQDGSFGEPLRPDRIVTIGPADSVEVPVPTVAPPPDEEASLPALGIDTSRDSGWTPYQPPVAEANGVAPLVDRSTTDRPAGRFRTASFHDVEADLDDAPAPPSEEIPVDTDPPESDPFPPEPRTDEMATTPRLPLDSDEIPIEEAERVTDPGEVDEVEADDLVSVEAISTPPPPPAAAPVVAATPAAKPAPVTSAALIAGVAPPASAPRPGSITSAGANPSGPPSARTSSPPPALHPAPASVPPPAPSASGGGLPAAPSPSPPAVAAIPVGAPASPGSMVAAAAPSAASGGASGPVMAPPRPSARPGSGRRIPAQPPAGFLPAVAGLAPPPMSEAAASRKKTRPWWEELFNDDYIRTMAKITDDQILAEITFIEDSLACEAGAMILDLACGTGRHAVELTSRGYQVVGFDLSLAMLARASDEAQDRGAKMNFVQGDMREMTFEDVFDGIYCWNTSFGYFDEEKNNAVVARVHRALKKGGQFLLDVVNRDYIIQQAPSLAWFEGDGCICMDEMQIDFITSRMKVKRTLMMDDGRTKEIEYSIRIYALHELGKMLHDNGFRVAEVSGRTGTPGVFFGCESPRTLILAEKR